MTSPRNSGPVAGNQSTPSSQSESVGYLAEFVRFMQTENKWQTQHKVFKQLDTGEDNTNLAPSLQEAISNRSNGQSGIFKVEVVDKKSSADIAKSAYASSQDFAMMSLGSSPTLSPLGSIEKRAIVTENLGSNTVVEMKHHMIKTEKFEHEKTECENVTNEKPKSGKTESIKPGKVDSKMRKDKKTETDIIKSETSPVTVATNYTFVSRVGCEESSRVKITATGLASASDSSEVQSHKKVINALGSLLELKKTQGVRTSTGFQDGGCYSVQETMAALKKFTGVSLTPVSSLQKLKMMNEVQLDTGQMSIESSSDTSVCESPVMPTTRKDSMISGHTCSMYKVDISGMGSKIDKLKSEPKPQTGFRIQINERNEMYFCNTETGEIKPLNTVKSAKKLSQNNPRSTPVFVEPSNNVSVGSKRTSLGGLPLHPVRVAGSNQNVIAEATNTVMKADESQQVSKTAPVNIPVPGMSDTPSHIPKLSPSQLVSKSGNMTFPGTPVTSSVSKWSQSELVVKPSQGNRSSMLMHPPHVPKLVIRKSTSTPPVPSERQYAAAATERQKPNRRKPKHIIHNARDKMSRHTVELQEALESCVESMLATDKDDNSLTLFGHGNTFDKAEADESLPGYPEGAIQTFDVNSSNSMPQMFQPDKYWSSLGREVTVETTTASPPVLEALPPLLEPAGSHQFTSTGEEGSSQPPQLVPESNASIRTVSKAHITAKNRKCKLYYLN
jgi:hypothetical protein